MRSAPLVLVLALLAVALVAPAVAQAGAPSVPRARVLDPPSPVAGTDARRHLVYEVIVENVTRSRVRLERVEVRDPARPQRVLAAHRGRAVEGLMLGFARGAPTRTLARGEAGMLLLDVTLPPGARVPARLAHRFVLTRSGAGARPRLVTTRPRASGSTSGRPSASARRSAAPTWPSWGAAERPSRTVRRSSGLAAAPTSRSVTRSTSCASTRASPLRGRSGAQRELLRVRGRGGRRGGRAHRRHPRRRPGEHPAGRAPERRPQTTSAATS